MTIRPSLGAAVPAVLVTLASAPSGAQMPSSAHDLLGMALMETEGFVTYDSTAPIGTDGFEITGLVVPAMIGDGPMMTVRRITVEEVDWMALLEDQTPSVLRLRIEEAWIDLESIPEDLYYLQRAIGDQPVMDIDLAILQASDTLILETVAIEVRDRARIELSLVLVGVDPMAVEDPMALAMGAQLQTFRLLYRDMGLLANLNQRSYGLFQEITGTVDMAADELPDLADAVFLPLAGFLAAASMAGGSLTITMTPAAPVGFFEASMLDPVAAVDLLGLAIAYE